MGKFRVILFTETWELEKAISLLNGSLIKGDVEINGFTSLKEWAFSKICNYNFIPYNKLKEVDYDYIIACDFSADCPLKEKIINLGFDKQKIIKGRIIENPCFDMSYYDMLHKDPPSIISSTCFGGVICHDLDLPFMSPFVNLFVNDDEFYEMLKDLKSTIDSPIQEKINTDNNINYPVGLLNNGKSIIEVHFNHYNNFDEAKRIWDKRKERINYNNIIVTSIIWNQESLKKFLQITYKKIGFAFTKLDQEYDDVLDCTMFFDPDIRKKTSNYYWKFLHDSSYENERRQFPRLYDPYKLLLKKTGWKLSHGTILNNKIDFQEANSALSNLQNVVNIMFLDLDGSYLPYLFVLITSLLDNHSDSTKFVFFLGYVNTPKEEMDKLKNYVISKGAEMFLIYADTSVFDGFKNFGKGGLHNYKIFPHLLLPDTVDRVLVLDTDIVVCDDILDLYNIDFSENELYAAAIDGGNSLEYVKNYPSSSQNKLDFGVNSGVLVANLVQLRKENCTIDAMVKKTGLPKSRLWEEGILYYGYRDRIRPVYDFRYNYNISRHDEYVEFCKKNKVEFNIKIRHFHVYTYPINSFLYRPWQLFFENNERLLYSDNELINRRIQDNFSYWWFYAKKSPNYDILRKNMLEIKDLHKFAASNYILKYTNKLSAQKGWYYNNSLFFEKFTSDLLYSHSAYDFIMDINNKRISIIKNNTLVGKFVHALLKKNNIEIIFTSDKDSIKDLSETEWNECKKADIIINCNIHTNIDDERDGIVSKNINSIFNSKNIENDFNSDNGLDLFSKKSENSNERVLKELSALNERIEQLADYKIKFEHEIEKNTQINNLINTYKAENSSCQSKITDLLECQTKLNKTINANNAQIASLSNNNQVLTDSLSEASIKLSEMKKQVDALAAERDKLNARISAIGNSRSWRWTRIFRRNKKDEEI